MASRGQKVAKAVPFSASDLASIKDNPYIQRVIEDGALRDNVTNVIESGKGAYERLASNGAPHKAVLEDDKLHRHVESAAASIRDIALALNDVDTKHNQPFKKKKQRGRKLLLVLLIGAGVALVALRGPAQQAARRAVRQRGGVPVHAAGARADGAAGQSGQRGLSPAAVLRPDSHSIRAPFGGALFRGGGGRQRPAPRIPSAMEAAATQQRQIGAELTGDKAARIVEAMRRSVATRGIAGSTFDHVAREAGCLPRPAALLLPDQGAPAARGRSPRVRSARRVARPSRRKCRDADGLIDGLVTAFREAFGETGDSFQTFYELLLLGQRNGDVADELQELAGRTRQRLGEALRAGAAAGVFTLRADPIDFAGFLFVLADGMAIRRLSEPELSLEPLLDQAIGAARALVA